MIQIATDPLNCNKLVCNALFSLYHEIQHIDTCVVNYLLLLEASFAFNSELFNKTRRLRVSFVSSCILHHVSDDCCVSTYLDCFC